MKNARPRSLGRSNYPRLSRALTGPEAKALSAALDSLFAGGRSRRTSGHPQFTAVPLHQAKPVDRTHRK